MEFPSIMETIINKKHTVSNGDSAIKKKKKHGRGKGLQFKIAWSEESTLRQLSHDQNEGKP